MGDAFENCLQLRSAETEDNNTDLWSIRFRIRKEKVPREAGARRHLYLHLVHRHVLKTKAQSELSEKG